MKELKLKVIFSTVLYGDEWSVSLSIHGVRVPPLSGGGGSARLENQQAILV
jgi:hypothetical protein